MMPALRVAKSAQGISRYMPQLLLFLFLAMGFIYMAFIPPFEGPDEPQHFAYVTWVARTNSLPPAGEAADNAGIEHEASQHPLYYVVASLPVRLVDLDDPPIVYRPNPHFIGPLARDYPDNDNRAIHYEGDGQPLAGGWLAFYMARGVTLLFGTLLLIAVYGLARQIWPGDRPAAYQSMLLAAAIPQVLFLSAVVSNDVPVATLGACTLWALARLLRRGYSAPRAVLLGVLFGLAVLTKASALALAAPLAVGLLWLQRRTGQSWVRFVQMGALVGGAALLVSGWWFVRSWLLFGSPFGLETHAATTWAIGDPADVELAWRRWWEVFRSFWLWFGWGTVRAVDSFYLIMALAALAAVAGMMRGLWQTARAAQGRRATPGQGAIILTVAAVAVAAVALTLELWMREVIAPFGRLLYPALGAVVVLLFTGWRQIHRRLPAVAAVFLALAAVLSPWLVLQPAYARPVVLTAEEAEALEPGPGIRFAEPGGRPFAELLLVDVLQQSVTTGDVAPVRVCWRALAQPAKDYSLLLQIIGPQERRIAGRSTYPGLGAYPTSQWQVGDVFCDRVQIEIGSDVEMDPLAYQLEVAMLDVGLNERLPMFDAQGTPLAVAFPERIRVYSPSRIARVDAERTLSGDGPQLLDATVANATWEAGEDHAFELRWATSQPLTTNYQTFVHLRAPDAVEPVAQADGPPLDGWYPTSWWTVAEIVHDARQFALPPDTPPGTYHLYVGLYDLAGGAPVTQAYDLGAIQVR